MKKKELFSIIVALIFVIIIILFLRYQPRFHNNDLISPCGIVVGGMWQNNTKPPNRICHCNGNIKVEDKRYVDGDRKEYCLGNGWSILNY